MKKYLLLSAVILSFSAVAAVKVPGIFSDHAVLARKSVTPVFGKADPGEKVVVEFNGQKKETVAGKDGKWRVDLNLADSPEGPFELKINDLIIKDVIVGEVWLCSGQSNMAWKMAKTEGFGEAVAKPVGCRLRTFNVKLQSSAKPEDQVVGSWVCADPAHIGSFSAVAYFFGRKLLKELNTPIGLVNASWGGSPIEAWLTTDAAKVVPAVAKRDLATSKAFAAYPAKRKKYILDFDAWAKKYGRADLPHVYPGAGVKWNKRRSANVASSVTWLRTAVNFSGGDVFFNMQRQRAPFTVWIDGKKVFTWSLENAVLARYPRFTVKNVQPGKHDVAFRFYAPQDGNIFPNTQMTIGGKNIDGIQWDVYQEAGFKNKTAREPRYPGATPREFFNTQRLFNGCINPIVPYALDGVIWYQGETNAGRYREYAALMRALVSDWRKYFENPELPFYWCNLASFQAKNSDPGAVEAYAYLRGAQTEALDVPHTGQAILIDAGEASDIHPRNKIVPGERLAAIALANVYGKKVPFAGPTMREVVREGKKLRISFDHVHGGLEAHPVPDFHYIRKRNNERAKLVRNSPAAQLEGFAVCGKDGKWVWADEAFIDGDTVVVSAGAVPEPVKVRYAWQSNPTCNLYNKAGFPAVPFISK